MPVSCNAPTSRLEQMTNAFHASHNCNLQHAISYKLYIDIVSRCRVVQDILKFWNFLPSTISESSKLALVVANCQSQERAHHAAAISDVAVEQEIWVGNLHLLIVRVNVVHQGIHRLGEVIGGAHVHVGTSRGLSSKVSSGGQIVVASLGLHDVGNQHVLSVPVRSRNLMLAGTSPFKRPVPIKILIYSW